MVRTGLESEGSGRTGHLSKGSEDLEIFHNKVTN